MARPKKQTIEYFPHYVNHHKTMFVLESKYGNDGYAFWFKTLEILGSTNGMVYDCNNVAEWEFLLAKTHLSSETANNILDTLADLEAIDKELWQQKIIWSQNLVDNVMDAFKRRIAEMPVKPSLCIQKPPLNEVSVNGNRESKVNESKVNESKEESNKVSITETHTQSIELCKYYEQLKPGENITSQLPTLKIWIEKYGFDWTKEVIQICVSKKNRLIIPWVEKVLQNWQSEGKPAETSKTNYKSKKPSGWDLKEQRQMDPELEKKLLENSAVDEPTEDPMEMLRKYREENQHATG